MTDKTNAVIYKADGTQVLIPCKEVTLEKAQEIVGGLVQQVFPRNTPNIMILCDEEGLMKDKPPNMIATAIYGGMIVGDVIVMTHDGAKASGWLD